jgi:hypothetical protein
MLIADEDVLRATADAVRQLQRLGIGYDDLFSPLTDEGLHEALRRLTIRASGHALGTGANAPLELVTPPLYGRYLLLWSTDVDDDRRRFALRHGMGHVVAGHVTTPRFLAADGDWTAPVERTADLFALADLVPFPQISALKRGNSWRAVRDEIAALVWMHTLDWPAERVQDRAVMRVALFRELGL